MPGGKTRSDVLRLNERIKHGVGVATAWANALFIAGFGTWIVRGFRGDVLVSLIASLAIISVASYALTTLEAEPDDE